MEEKVKKTFEEPKVEKVEFDFKTRIAASYCGPGNQSCPNDGECENIIFN
jgi:hypothetical protein